MTKQLISHRNVILTYSAIWLLLVTAQAWILHQLTITWGIAVTDSIATNLLLAISGFATMNVLRFYQPTGRNFFYLFASALMLSLVSVYLQKWIMAQLFSDDVAYQSQLEQSVVIRFAFAMLIITCTNLLGWGWYNFKSSRDNEARKTDAERLAREAELFKLRQQLQPHFLFNSLNSISALAGSKPEEARKMIQQLSDFLRGTLKKEEQQLVTLQEELQHLGLYLDIEKVRFGYRLNTIIEADNASLGKQLPSLLLQPVMENAIKFGLYDTTGEVTIHLTATTETNLLIIRIENPFEESTITGVKKGTGFGLASVQRRLFLLYSRQDLLQTSANGNIFMTTLKIPQLS